jgi:GNAT superfamily N-acetyltransferase
VEIRLASPADVGAIIEFGATFVSDHYSPLIGETAANAQIERWWTPERLSTASIEGRVVVAEGGDGIVGVGEWSCYESVPVIWKLYVHPLFRSRGIGKALIRKIIAALPEGTSRLQVEHFSVNRRAAEFYVKEGFAKLHTSEHPTDPGLNVDWRELSLR